VSVFAPRPVSPVMKTNLLLTFALGAALLVPARATLDISVAAEIRLGKALPPPPPEVVVIEETGPKGPPPWAPAHGFRRNRGYYYYPGADVYYRPDDRMWFFLDGGTWRVGVNLPTAIRVDFDRSVSLTMETDQPYQFHEKVRTYYPANYFVTQVRVKEKGGKLDREEKTEAGKPDHPGHSGDHDRGKGKGKGKNK
jgi:hypothetical protein